MAGAFSEAFLAGEPRAEAFLPVDFRRADARRAHVMRARERRSSLVPQGSVAVVTGQQVGLFLGPLYSVYKAATAIACARALENETQVRCVPVFWLQTEDHDLEEIDHVFIVDREGQLTRLALSIAGSRCSVEHVMLGESVLPLLERLGEGCELFRAHYRPEATLAQAFEGTLRELFEGDGLVIVNPCAHDATPVHLKALREAPEISRLLEQRQRELGAAGFDVQVHIRPACPLSFFHPDGPKGPRFRLVPKGSGYALSGREGEVSREAVERGPFSTSALLRPIVQDTLLPTAAIVGGPGECNYFAQLSPLYGHFGLPMPMFVPRARFEVLDARTRALREKPAPKPSVAPEEIERALVAAAEAELAKVPASDAGVADAVKITRGTIARAASRLAGRYRRAVETTDSVGVKRAERLRNMLRPNGEPQERVLGLPTFGRHTDLRAFKELVLKSVDPWNPQLKELSL